MSNYTINNFIGQRLLDNKAMPKGAKDVAVSQNQWIRTHFWLVNAYNHPSRKYHNLLHVISMIDYLRDEINMPSGTIGPDQINQACIAAWFHDALYDPQRTDNEERSALVAKLDLKAMGFHPSYIKEVTDMIMLTKTHDVRRIKSPIQGLFLNADLVVLNTLSLSTYMAYAIGVHMEYLEAGFTTQNYIDGRMKWLRMMIKRKTILFDGEDEQCIRPNLEMELHILEECKGGTIVWDPFLVAGHRGDQSYGVPEATHKPKRSKPSRSA